ncbi:MAG: DUF4293 domain-containing protein [Bacteroidales bacterium]
MIQRVQTLWLLLAVLLSVAAFFFPIAIFQFPYREHSLDAIYKLLPLNTAPYQYAPAWFSIFFNCITGVITVITIFLYKNRRLQMKVLAFAFLSSLIELAGLYFYQIDAGLTDAISNIYNATPEIIKSTVNVAKTTWGLASFFPIAQIVFFVFALKGIKKDESLVRSADRIR